MDGTGFRRRISGIATRCAQPSDRTDDDQTAAAGLQSRGQLLGASHQAVEVDLYNLAEGFRLEFPAAVLHRALRQNHDVESFEGWGPAVDRTRFSNIQAGKGKGGEGFGTVAVSLFAGAGACDGNAGAARSECLGAGQTDSARAADDQDVLAGAVEVHGVPKTNK